MELPAETAQRESKKLKQEPSGVTFPHDSNWFWNVLGLGSASIWEYLPPADVVKLLQLGHGRFSQDIIDVVSLKALDQFAEKSHSGRRCICFWMRGLDFLPHSRQGCQVASPYCVEKKMTMLQSPGGAHALLSALVLTKNLLEQFYSDTGYDDLVHALMVPTVCVLPTEGEKLDLSGKGAIARALNKLCSGAGLRFFYDITEKKSCMRPDFLDEHWYGIKGTECQHCESLANAIIKKGKSFRWKRTAIDRAREICLKFYRPLKASMEKDLHQVCFICRPRDTFELSLDGLVSGITKDGILCGLYLVYRH